ncbi:MAG: hypothetical protein IKS49_00975 [Actinomycetaceae bacterium]|nr:hypothetical protein [Actinomycetaceae bacterium]
MSTNKHERSYFAQELNDILAGISMTPEDIVRELNKQGFPLPLHTFSYWLQGYFLPRSDSAFQLVGTLEGICGITDNRLSDALLHDLSSGASFVPGADASSELVGSVPSDASTRFATVADRMIDWEANLIQRAVRDEIWISSDYKYTRHKATVLARVPAVPNPTFVFQLIYEPYETVGGDDYFYDLAGIELKKQELFDEGDGIRVCAAQFSLPDDVVPGDLHRLSYSWDESSQIPREKLSERFLPWSLDFYSSTITFEGGVPDDIRYVVFMPMGEQEVEIDSDIPLIREGNTVSISTKNFGNIIGSFRYTAPVK